ncbi:MAG: hypothetical protein ACI4XJ_00955 [Eubacteriales bacterium]
MTDKELQRLNRSELLELLISQTKENEKLKIRLEQAEEQLRDRKIEIDKAGSIAEAALSLSGIFDAAQNAAQQYLENIQLLNSRQEEICRDMQTNAEKQAEEIMNNARKYSKRAHDEADSYWREIIAKATALLRDQDVLRQAVESAKAELNEEEN